MERFFAYCRQIGWKRFWIMIIGNVFLGIGVGLFKLSAMGNDPYNGMNMALAEITGIPYPVLQIIVNAGLFLIQVLLNRHLVGFGTVINACFLGYMATFVYNTTGGIFGFPTTFGSRLFAVLLGVVISSFGLSLYQNADVGVSPYDAVVLILDQRLKRVSFFWCRMMIDGACALICFLSGGIVGLGMLVAVFGLGPCIQFFNWSFTRRVLFPERQG